MFQAHAIITGKLVLCYMSLCNDVSIKLGYQHKCELFGVEVQCSLVPLINIKLNDTHLLKTPLF